MIFKSAASKDFILKKDDYEIIKQRGEGKTCSEVLGREKAPSTVYYRELLILSILSGREERKIKDLSKNREKIKDRASKLVFEELKKTREIINQLKKFTKDTRRQIEENLQIFWRNTTNKLTENDYKIFKNKLDDKTLEEKKEDIGKGVTRIRRGEWIIISKFLGKHNTNTKTIVTNFTAIKQEADKFVFSELDKKDIKRVDAQLNRYGNVTEKDLQEFWRKMTNKLIKEDHIIFTERAEGKLQRDIADKIDTSSETVYNHQLLILLKLIGKHSETTKTIVGKKKEIRQKLMKIGFKGIKNEDLIRVKKQLEVYGSIKDEYFKKFWKMTAEVRSVMTIEKAKEKYRYCPECHQLLINIIEKKDNRIRCKNCEYIFT